MSEVSHVVAEVRRAVETGDTAALKRVLHPYLHWTEDGRTTRGRTNVLALLATRTSLPEPASTELRDTQLYRWTTP